MLKITKILLLGMITLTIGCQTVQPVNVDSSQVAIKGYDPVAYFVESKPVKGSPEINTTWQDAKWYFVSNDNLNLFEKNPEKYAPQYGGYCAWAVSQGYTADVSPDSWKIVDGKLYLNYNSDIQKTWEENHLQFIQDGDKNWPKILAENAKKSE